jgi:hypothetical protein
MKFVAAAALICASFIVCSCVQAQPASDTGDPGFPFGPSSLGVQPQPLAYVQDIKPILDQDCVECHGGRRTDGGYRANTYAGTMSGQRPGDASSSLVVDAAPGGSMYQYWSGDRTAKATLVFRWMVTYHAAETR